MASRASVKLGDYVDLHLTEALGAPITHPFGTHVKDRRKAAFYLHACAWTDSHRIVCTFEAMTRRYNTCECKQQVPLKCLACRICHIHDDAWFGSRQPSKLERLAYTHIHLMHADNYYICTEWYVPNSNKSIDVVLIKKTDKSTRVAVHIDGRQHLDDDTALRDAAFDATLLQMGFTRVVRLPQDHIHEWRNLLTFTAL